MTDIWDMVADNLTTQVRYALLEIRETAPFAAMGSEIERAFAAYIVLGAKLNGSFPLMLELPMAGGPGFFLAPQVKIGQYRADFVFGYVSTFNDRKRWVVVECDGHDFHQLTKEQVARDKARDRFLSAEVGKVIRFTGSEIYRDVGACLGDLFKVLKAANP